MHDFFLIAGNIHQKGLSTPAIFFLEMHKPLVGSFSILADAFAPVMKLFIDPKYYASFVEIMKKPGAIELLIQELENKREEHYAAR